MESFINNNSNRKAFLFSLDNTIFPLRDYDYQVFYLFGQFIEFTLPGIHQGKDITNYLIANYTLMSKDDLIKSTLNHFAIPDEFTENFNRLFTIARLPLKLLIFPKIKELIELLTLNNKQVFIISKGELKSQVNKISQIEWGNLAKDIKVYYLDEMPNKTTKELFSYISTQNNIKLSEMLWIDNEQERNLRKNPKVLNVNELL